MTSRVIVVTSMNAAGWQEYGKRFVATFREMWPSEIALELYAEGFEADISDPRVLVRDFDECCGEKSARFQELFRAVLPRLNIASGQVAQGLNYKLQADKFAKKGFVITDALRRHAGDHVIWLDADVVTFAAISLKFLKEIIRFDDPRVFCAHLRRFGMHTESGFLSFNTRHFLCNDFVDRYESLYLSGGVLHLEGWTDCHVFDCVKAQHVSEGGVAAYFEIPSLGNWHVFVNSPLGLLMDHLKGNRKIQGKTGIDDYVIPPRQRVKFDGRYTQLQPLIRLFRPTSFLEIGTWSGWRAVSMALEASRYADSIKYRGYDVFEKGTQELDGKEKNVKPHFTEASVRHLLDFCRFLNPGFSYELVSGDTNVTLRRGDAADFAFIDGGHSVETIENDFFAVDQSRVVLLDDYYEGPIDTDRFGCNKVLEGIPHRVLPVGDPVKGGGRVKFAVVASEEYLQLVDQLSTEMSGGMSSDAG